MVIIAAGETYFQQIIQYKAGREPVISSMSSANLWEKKTKCCYQHQSLVWMSRQECLPLDAIHVTYCDAFEQSDNQQWIAAGKTVHELKDVAASTVSKYNRYATARYA